MAANALLQAWQEACPAAKCDQVMALEAGADFDPPRQDWIDPVSPGPGRPDAPLLVPPRELPRRGLGTIEGRVALIHAVAHIEFNAINLALDAALRFQQMPQAFRADWISVAQDEARHFSMLANRLQELGHRYGDLPAHNGLWEAACKTANDVLERMALVPRVLEARGLDVTPGMINRLTEVGDQDTVALLKIILSEEVRHVEIGTHWYRTLCRQQGLDPIKTFRSVCQRHRVQLRGPFNMAARTRAGFEPAELELF